MIRNLQNVAVWLATVALCAIALYGNLWAIKVMAEANAPAIEAQLELVSVAIRKAEELVGGVRRGGSDGRR